MEQQVRNSVISIVDDDESVRRTLTRMVRFTGLEAESFGSAEEFLECAESKDYACLILDVNLPGISGMDLQRQLNAADRKIPIIFISAHFDEKTQAIAMEEGALRFLGKPFNWDSLLDAIHSVVPLNKRPHTGPLTLS